MTLIFKILIVAICQNALADGSVLGRWKTIDDKTQKPKSVIEIISSGSGLKGRIVELINPAHKDPRCEKCQGEQKDQSIVGLEILSGFKSEEGGQKWTDGEVLDPENGKTYKCRLRLKDEGKSLEVRGYVGISIFGRSQTWVREGN